MICCKIPIINLSEPAGGVVRIAQSTRAERSGETWPRLPRLFRFGNRSMQKVIEFRGPRSNAASERRRRRRRRSSRYRRWSNHCPVPSNASRPCARPSQPDRSATSWRLNDQISSSGFLSPGSPRCDCLPASRQAMFQPARTCRSPTAADGRSRIIARCASTAGPAGRPRRAPDRSSAASLSESSSTPSRGSPASAA